MSACSSFCLFHNLNLFFLNMLKRLLKRIWEFTIQPYFKHLTMSETCLKIVISDTKKNCKKESKYKRVNVNQAREIY